MYNGLKITIGSHSKKKKTERITESIIELVTDDDINKIREHIVKIFDIVPFSCRMCEQCKLQTYGIFGNKCGKCVSERFDYDRAVFDVTKIVTNLSLYPQHAVIKEYDLIFGNDDVELSNNFIYSVKRIILRRLKDLIFACDTNAQVKLLFGGHFYFCINYDIKCLLFSDFDTFKKDGGLTDNVNVFVKDMFERRFGLEVIVQFTDKHNHIFNVKIYLLSMNITKQHVLNNITSRNSCNISLNDENLSCDGVNVKFKKIKIIIGNVFDSVILSSNGNDLLKSIVNTLNNTHFNQYIIETNLFMESRKSFFNKLKNRYVVHNSNTYKGFSEQWTINFNCAFECSDPLYNSFFMICVAMESFFRKYYSLKCALCRCCGKHIKVHLYGLCCKCVLEKSKLVIQEQLIDTRKIARQIKQTSISRKFITFLKMFACEIEKHYMFIVTMSGIDTVMRNNINYQIIFIHYIITLCIDNVIANVDISVGTSVVALQTANTMKGLKIEVHDPNESKMNLLKYENTHIVKDSMKNIEFRGKNLFWNDLFNLLFYEHSYFDNIDALILREQKITHADQYYDFAVILNDDIILVEIDDKSHDDVLVKERDHMKNLVANFMLCNLIRVNVRKCLKDIMGYYVMLELFEGIKQAINSHIH